MITVLDVVVPGVGDHWDKLAPVLAETDVFLPNDDEAALITGLTDPLAQAERFRAAGARTVVITQGLHGAMLVSDQVRLRTGVYPTQFVGATGIRRRLRRRLISPACSPAADPLGCLKWGAAPGASCVRSLSATESVFNREKKPRILSAATSCRFRFCENLQRLVSLQNVMETGCHAQL